MMKLMIRLGMMAIALLAMVSCSSSSPSGALEDYMSALQNKNMKSLWMVSTSVKEVLTKSNRLVKD